MQLDVSAKTVSHWTDTEATSDNNCTITFTKASGSHNTSYHVKKEWLAQLVTFLSDQNNRMRAAADPPPPSDTTLESRSCSYKAPAVELMEPEDVGGCGHHLNPMAIKKLTFLRDFEQLGWELGWGKWIMPFTSPSPPLNRSFLHLPISHRDHLLSHKRFHAPSLEEELLVAVGGILAPRPPIMIWITTAITYHLSPLSDLFIGNEGSSHHQLRVERHRRLSEPPSPSLESFMRFSHDIFNPLMVSRKHNHPLMPHSCCSRQCHWLKVLDGVQEGLCRDHASSQPLCLSTEEALIRSLLLPLEPPYNPPVSFSALMFSTDFSSARGKGAANDPVVSSEEAWSLMHSLFASTSKILHLISLAPPWLARAWSWYAHTIIRATELLMPLFFNLPFGQVTALLIWLIAPEAIPAYRAIVYLSPHHPLLALLITLASGYKLCLRGSILSEAFKGDLWSFQPGLWFEPHDSMTMALVERVVRSECGLWPVVPGRGEREREDRYLPPFIPYSLLLQIPYFLVHSHGYNGTWIKGYCSSVAWILATLLPGTGLDASWRNFTSASAQLTPLLFKPGSIHQQFMLLFAATLLVALFRLHEQWDQVFSSVTRFNALRQIEGHNPNLQGANVNNRRARVLQRAHELLAHLMQVPGGQGGMAEGQARRRNNEAIARQVAERLEGHEEGLEVVLDLLRRRAWGQNPPGGPLIPGAAGGQGNNAPAVGAAANANGTPGTSSANTVHWPPALVVPSWMEEAMDEEAMTIPDAFKCPISFSLMREPTSTSSGHTYERSAIFQWLNIRRVCPVTQVMLKRHRLTPNLSLRTLIEAWIEDKDKEREAALESQAKDKAEHASDSETSQEGDDSECPTPSERDLN